MDGAEPWLRRGRAADRSVVREELSKRKTIYPLKCATSIIELPGKQEKQRCELQRCELGFPAADDAVRAHGGIWSSD